MSAAGPQSKKQKVEYEEEEYPADLMEIVTDLISKLTAENGPCKANAQRVPPVTKFLTQYCDLWKPSEEKKEPDEKEKEKMKKEFQSYAVDKKLLTGLFVSKGFNRNLPSGNKFTKTFTAILQALAKLHKPDFSDLVLPGRDEWNGVRIKAKFANELNNQKKEFSKNSTFGTGGGSGTNNVLKQRKRKYDGEDKEETGVEDKEKTVTLPWDMVQAGQFHYFLRITAPFCNAQDIMGQASYVDGKLIIKGMYTTSAKLPMFLSQNYRLTSYNTVVGGNFAPQQPFYNEIQLPKDIDFSKKAEFGEVDSGVIVTYHRLMNYAPVPSSAFSMSFLPQLPKISSETHSLPPIPSPASNSSQNPLQLSSQLQSDLLSALPSQYPNPYVKPEPSS